jgi:sugar lactone lactonase YvrE
MVFGDSNGGVPHLRRNAFSFFVVLGFLAFPALCAAQGFTIATVAGDGILGYTGDNGPALSAELFPQAGVTVDAAGNVYVADTGNCRIRKISKGTITTVAGNGLCTFGGDGLAATAAQLNFPRGMAFDTAGNMYIVDTGNQRVRKVDLNGIITTIAGDGTTNFSGDGGPATSAELAEPWGVAVDKTGNIFVVDRDNQRIRVIGTNGIINTVAGNGTQAHTGDGGPATLASLLVPDAVALDTMGNFYIVEANSATVRKVNSQGIIQTVAGGGTFGYSGDGGPATQALLNDPQGAAVDAAGNIYIADEDNARVRVVTLDGNINTIAGNGTKGFSGDGGPAANSLVNLPEGIAVGLDGVVYFVDSGNRRVRSLTPNSLCDMNGDGSLNVADVQLIINEALGTAPAKNDVNRDGVVNIADVQIVINAALGQGCTAV